MKYKCIREVDEIVKKNENIKKIILCIGVCLNIIFIVAIIFIRKDSDFESQCIRYSSEYTVIDEGADGIIVEIESPDFYEIATQMLVDNENVSDWAAMKTYINKNSEDLKNYHIVVEKDEAEIINQMFMNEVVGELVRAGIETIEYSEAWEWSMEE